MFRAIIILCGIMLSSSVLAETGNEIISNNSNHQFLLGISAGPTWATGNKTQTLFLQPDVQKTYTADNNWTAFPSAELFIGWQKPLSLTLMGQSLLSQLGIAFVGAGNAELSGDIWEDADPDFDNFNYDYKIKHAHAAIKGRLITNSCWIFNGFISASLGLGFNRAYDFTIQPKISEEVAAPAFTSNTQTALVYTLGIGLQKSLNPQFQVAIGYEFADWGKIQLSPAASQTLNQGLSLNHLYAHQIQLSLFYIV